MRAPLSPGSLASTRLFREYAPIVRFGNGDCGAPWHRQNKGGKLLPMGNTPLPSR